MTLAIVVFDIGAIKINMFYRFSIWQWVKTNSTPVVHIVIKIAGINGCSSP